MSDKEWLKSLKAGDKVIVQHRGFDVGQSLMVVDHLTQNFIVVGDTKFRKESGYGTGDGYHHPYLIEVTPEALEKIEQDRIHRKLQRYLQNVDVQNVPIEVAKHVVELLDPYIKRIEAKE